MDAGLESSECEVVTGLARAIFFSINTLVGVGSDNVGDSGEGVGDDVGSEETSFAISEKSGTGAQEEKKSTPTITTVST